MRMQTAIFQALTFTSVAVFSFSVPAAHAATYEIDPVHSYVGFGAKHLNISTVKGSFTDFSGTFNYDPANESASSVTATVKVPSINTHQVKRDDHLRSPDFFNAAEFPTMTFKSTKFEPTGEGRYTMTGDLTIRGVTKPVTFEVERTGMGKGMQGEERAAFSAKTTIDRTDFGVAWNKALESGGFVIGDDIAVKLLIQGVKK